MQFLVATSVCSSMLWSFLICAVFGWLSDVLKEFLLLFVLRYKTIMSSELFVCVFSPDWELEVSTFAEPWAQTWHHLPSPNGILNNGTTSTTRCDSQRWRLKKDGGDSHLGWEKGVFFFFKPAQECVCVYCHRVQNVVHVNCHFLLKQDV